MVVYSEEHTRHINTLYVHNMEFFNVKKACGKHKLGFK
jgi:hypothetical protein